MLPTNFWLLAAQINHAQQFLEASGKAGACDIMSPLARLDWCCRIHSATSQSLPDRKSRRERRKRRWNRDGKKSTAVGDRNERKKRRTSKEKKKERVVPAKNVPCYSYSSVFQVCTGDRVWAADSETRRQTANIWAIPARFLVNHTVACWDSCPCSRLRK